MSDDNLMEWLDNNKQQLGDGLYLEGCQLAQQVHKDRQKRLHNYFWGQLVTQATTALHHHPVQNVSLRFVHNEELGDLDYNLTLKFTAQPPLGYSDGDPIVWTSRGGFMDISTGEEGDCSIMFNFLTNSLEVTFISSTAEIDQEHIRLTNHKEFLKYSCCFPFLEPL
jgi:hypothetical protein